MVLLVATALSAARAEWRFDAETGALYNSNLSNSDRGSEEKDDWAWLSDLRVVDALQLARDVRLDLGAGLHREAWARFDAFDNIAPGATVGLRYRFGLGRQAPWVRIEDGLAYAFFNEDNRSGRDNSLRVTGGFGITERLSVEAAYIFEDFEAKDRFWSWSAHNAGLRLTYDLTSSLQVALGYSYRDGEVISYATPPRPDLFRLASDLDAVNSFEGFPYTAYKLRGETNALSASAGYTLNKYLSIELDYEFRNTSHGPLDYTNHLVEAKIVFAY